jgi:hypothetical protein
VELEVVFQLFHARLVEEQAKLESTIEQAGRAITEGRDAVQGLRASTVQTNDLAQAIGTLGDQLAADPANEFRVTVQGESRDLHPILRADIYKSRESRCGTPFGTPNRGT